MAGETKINSGNEKLNEKINEWLSWDKNEDTRSEVQELCREGSWEELKSLLLRGRLHFGTAGLRGPMRAGYTCMNDLVVLQTAQGLCEYVKKTCSDEELNAGLVIGYDGRHNSKRFAELTARVFVSSSIRVCLFGSTCPTPWVSFAVRLFGAAAGVMVTASHNPKEDNGYKVYWSNAAQIIAPHDANIEASIEENLEVPAAHWNTEGIHTHSLVSDQLREVTAEYLGRLRDQVPREQDADIARAKCSFVYSAMHGVGFPYIEEAFNYIGLQPVIPVIEQQDPDPDFPTVMFPNPEEPSSLALSLKLAEHEGCRVVLANDPDADRLAVAEFQAESEQWHILTGNELGALLGWWLIRSYKRRPDADEYGDTSDAVLLASAVSSKMLRDIASAEGATFIETLTGFKWMGSKAVQLQAEGKAPIFAFEEAIGFMCGCEVPDKDGISAAVHMAALVSHLAAAGGTLVGQLSKLYLQYGYHTSLNSYYICHDKQVLANIFERLRNYNGTSGYPSHLREWEISSVRDLGLCADPQATSGTGLDSPLTSGQMLTLTFANGLEATLRTSGTEPKIKYYTELCAQPGQADEEDLELLLKSMVEALTEDFLQPKLNGLIDRK